MAIDKSKSLRLTFGVVAFLVCANIFFYLFWNYDSSGQGINFFAIKSFNEGNGIGKFFVMIASVFGLFAMLAVSYFIIKHHKNKYLLPIEVTKTKFI